MKQVQRVLKRLTLGTMWGFSHRCYITVWSDGGIWLTEQVVCEIICS